MDSMDQMDDREEITRDVREEMRDERLGRWSGQERSHDTREKREGRRLREGKRLREGIRVTMSEFILLNALVGALKLMASMRT